MNNLKIFKIKMKQIKFKMSKTKIIKFIKFQINRILDNKKFQIK